MSEEKPILGRDLRLVETELGVDLSVSARGDLQTVRDELNLGQAIVHRFRTRKGELADIGRSNYGSRLYELIGEPNNETTRERAKAIVRDALRQDPRVKEIVRITVETRKGSLDIIDIDITVIAIGSNVPLNVVFPFHLEAV